MVFYVDHGRRSSNDSNTQIAFEVDFHLLSKLTEHLLVEILIRLPSESACRFKVVCKEWCRLISSKYFAGRYISHRCHDTPKSFTLVVTLENAEVVSPTSVLNYVHPVKAVSHHPLPSKLLESESFKTSLQYQFDRVYKPSNKQQQQLEDRHIYVETSCHDLLLLSDTFSYCVVNMHTAKFFMLPPAPKGFDVTLCYRKPGLLCYHDYGDDSSRFKLILVPFFKYNTKVKRLLGSSGFSINIYSSETGEWSEVKVRWSPFLLYAYVLETPIISLDRTLYWLDNRLLISLDPFSGDAQLGLCKDIRLPANSNWSLWGVCCGRIRLVDYLGEAGSYVLRVWDLDSNKSWLLSHNIVLGKLSEVRFVPLAVHPYDSNVVYVEEENVIYLFDLRTLTLEEYHKLTFKDGEERIVVRCGIVALHRWFPTPIPSRNCPIW